MTEHQNNKIRYIFAVAFIIFACLTGIKSIHPSEKAYKLSPEHAGGDLVISCEFEDQTFPLAFISPSGEEAEATCHESGKFATYIIKDAEPGVWKVSYNETYGKTFIYSIKE
ncbi:hypothetical protein bpr_II336 (plasmid) [Butyrivibrio proteoclasticus B316]|uniref:Uncharacterized protein n=1 Tax=Butyrivibrio proteoclasticus (strain ATCC 51982 / DSM 14932 / B316) TaxID=515622 RepID=E0S4E1_BUTPB|nr:hypothetical protein bpr_II336 [Butyrivibrio proteoclasticus B316]